jgi:hypothetical protein
MPDQNQPAIPENSNEKQPVPYRHQRAMEQALKDTPGLTEEEFKKEAEAMGF